MKHVLYSSLFSSSISICEQKLKYWAAKCKIQPSDIQYIITYGTVQMLHIRSHRILTLFVVKTTLIHQLPTLHTMCAFSLYQDGVFSYLQCFGTGNIVHSRFQQYLTTFFSLFWKIARRGLSLFSQQTLQWTKNVLRVRKKIWNLNANISQYYILLVSVTFARSWSAEKNIAKITIIIFGKFLSTTPIWIWTPSEEVKILVNIFETV